MSIPAERAIIHCAPALSLLNAILSVKGTQMLHPADGGREAKQSASYMLFMLDVC
jgi:hypothetical protein